MSEVTSIHQVQDSDETGSSKARRISLAGRALMNEAAVVEFLGATVSTLRTWRANGKGPHSTKFGNEIWYYEDDLNIYLEKQKKISKAS